MSDQVYWVDPDGGTLCLSDDNPYRIRMGVDGRFMPQFAYTAESIYSIQGSVRRGTTLKDRTLTLPMLVFGEDQDDVRANIRSLMDATNPLRGMGRVQCVTNDDKTFILDSYLDGMPMPENPDSIGVSNGMTFRLFVATFVSHAVVWWNPIEHDVQIDYSTLDLPLALNNEGDLEAWPIWTISGPMTSVQIGNYTTGDYMAATLTLTAGQRVYIDSRESLRTVLQDHVTDVESSFSTDSDCFFPLVRGKNDIGIDFAGNSTATSLRVRWVDRYLGV